MDKTSSTIQQLALEQEKVKEDIPNFIQTTITTEQKLQIFEFDFFHARQVLTNMQSIPIDNLKNFNDIIAEISDCDVRSKHNYHYWSPDFRY